VDVDDGPPVTPALPTEVLVEPGCDVIDLGTVPRQVSPSASPDTTDEVAEELPYRLLSTNIPERLFEIEVEAPLNVGFRSMEVAQTTTILPADSGPELYRLVDPSDLRPIPLMRRLAAPLGSQLHVTR
jgi:hypothetical protein